MSWNNRFVVYKPVVVCFVKKLFQQKNKLTFATFHPLISDMNTFVYVKNLETWRVFSSCSKFLFLYEKNELLFSRQMLF
ncbi:hypothetical protein AYJ08_04375 [Brevibacillus sp. SKDU10]|nr:hypothetical protein AYJ08_04375 [Brevibacillus sp. SKDU10]